MDADGDLAILKKQCVALPGSKSEDLAVGLKCRELRKFLRVRVAGTVLFKPGEQAEFG